MSRSKVTSKGQTTIPIEIRHALKVRPGDWVVYDISGGVATLRRQPGIEAVSGILRGKFKRPLVSPRLEKKMAQLAWAREAGGAPTRSKRKVRP